MKFHDSCKSLVLVCVYIYIYISFCVPSPSLCLVMVKVRELKMGERNIYWNFILKFHDSCKSLVLVCVYIYIYLFLCAFTVTLFSYGERERKTWFSTIWLEWKGRGNKIGWVEFFTRAHLFFSLSPNWGEKMRENNNEFKSTKPPPTMLSFFF